MDKIRVELAYLKPSLQTVLVVNIAAGSTILLALQESKLLELFPELELEQLSLGIFSVPKKLDTKLVAGDRVEVYRPLVIDPKQARLDRVKKQKLKALSKQSLAK
jgi:putative ubiquitin-RnfH superfamily antitoxin RatB of RatAB toxin-antitoxin module